MDDQQHSGIGHNSQLPYDPDVIERLESRVRELADAGGAWLDLKQIETEEQAGKLGDLIAQTRAAFKEADDARKAAKEPHLEAGRLVDAKFKTFLVPLENLGKSLKSMAAAYMDRKRIEEEKRKAAEREEARRRQEEAGRLRREAEARNDVIAQAQAEEAAKEAAKAAKAAEKPVKVNVASATGGGRTMSMRTTYRAEAENLNRSFSFFRDHPVHGPKLREFIERLAEAEHRSKDGVKEIPGIIFREERTAA